VTTAGMTLVIRSFLLFVKSNKEVRMEYLDFMKTVSCTIVLGSEKERSNGMARQRIVLCRNIQQPGVIVF
jgi:hypothetical protein